MDELEELAHALSHDLRSPLRAISNLSEWLSEDQAERLDEGGREQLALLGERVAWLEGRVTALVEYARAAAAGAPEAIALANAVQDVWAEIEKPDDLALEVDLPLPDLCFDRTQLRTLLACLLENAARHAGDGARRVRVSARTEGFEVEVTVADDGVGIDAGHHERIFQLFQSLAGPGAGGVGAGLALARRIARARGGSLDVESEPGKGASFRLRVPTADVQPAAPDR